MLPNFLLVGGMKCGTTSLAGQLAAHPDIFMTADKEPRFFSHEDKWNRGVPWYESLFAAGADAKARGEASTAYATYPIFKGVPARIAQVLDDVRFLYMVRHPIDRIVSHYMHLWYRGSLGREGVEQAVEQVEELLAYSRYYYQIEQYLPFFPADRWLILVFEEFESDPAAVHRSICEFLGVDAGFVPPDVAPRNVTDQKVRSPVFWRWARRIPLARPIGRLLFPLDWRIRMVRWRGARRAKPDVSDELHNRLVERLSADVEALSEFAGRDLAEVWEFRKR